MSLLHLFLSLDYSAKELFLLFHLGIFDYTGNSESSNTICELQQPDRSYYFLPARVSRDVGQCVLFCSSHLLLGINYLSLTTQTKRVHKYPQMDTYNSQVFLLNLVYCKGKHCLTDIPSIVIRIHQQKLLSLIAKVLKQLTCNRNIKILQFCTLLMLIAGVV